MTKIHYYATHNTTADAIRGNRGALNTREVSRFPSRAERDAFVLAMGNKLARAVTRREAAGIFADCYLCIGRPVPRGGLFRPLERGDISPFWNEFTYWGES